MTEARSVSVSERSEDSCVASGGVDRRGALALLGLAGLGAAGSSALGQSRRDAAPAAGAGAGSDVWTAALGWDAAKGEYALPRLAYEYAALEPHVDAQTMEIHHSKHHASYVAGLNKALSELKRIRETDDAASAGLVKHWSRELAFHGGGHVNHSLFWMMMAPPGKGGGGEPTGTLAEAITRDFGSFAAFAKHFQAAAVQVEGSGWAWLVYDRVARRLMVQQMEKQQNLLVTGVVPVLGVDVWEHAYYLRYQNRRADYVKAWMNVVNWPVVGRFFEMAAAPTG
ncbi:MAG: superoxide dismutase [Planctomycetota bacterium]|nr:superoxide dismutase [Planctomycetota bacterium]